MTGRITTYETKAGHSFACPRRGARAQRETERTDFDAVLITGGTVRLENGVAQGGGENRFEPLRTCTRAEIVTFLRRTFGE